jgi:hypothetical protein
MRLPDFLINLTGRRQEGRAAEEELLRAVEKAADLVDPKIRWVSGYRRRLKPAVARTLAYADELIARIPGPIIIHAERWDKDPHLRAIFSSPEEIPATFGAHPKCRLLLEGSPAAPFFALLTMTRQEKATFGVAADGDLLRRDVPRIAVNFVDLRVIGPAPEERETHERLRRQTLSILCSTAMERILALRSRAQDLGEQREILKIKLKIRQSGRQELAALMCGTDACDVEIARARDELAEIEREIAAARTELGGPRECLDHVVRILSRPDEHLWVEPLRLRLTPLGLKVPEDSPEPAAAVELCELHVREGLQRAALFVRYETPRKSSENG